jgi:Na+-transporting NADH:ubiquinone oxidoreductase subunit A
MIKHNLKKGYGIKLAGKTEKIVVEAEKPKLFASQPPDFIGFKPRLEVEEGSEVKIGTSLYYDKQRPEIKFVSPASGKVAQINRGERRAIMEVVIESDNQNTAIDFGKHSVAELELLNADDIRKQLLEGGLWPVIRHFLKLLIRVLHQEIYLSVQWIPPLWLPIRNFYCKMRMKTSRPE